LLRERLFGNFQEDKAKPRVSTFTEDQLRLAA